MGQNLTFSNTVFKQDGNNGLGEWRAQFVTGGDQKLAGAFGNVAAKGSLSTKGGVVQLNHHQLADRIQQLNTAGGYEQTVGELAKGQKAIETRLATPAQKQTVTQGMRV